MGTNIEFSRKLGFPRLFSRNNYGAREGPKVCTTEWLYCVFCVKWAKRERGSEGW